MVPRIFQTILIFIKKQRTKGFLVSDLFAMGDPSRFPYKSRVPSYVKKLIEESITPLLDPLFNDENLRHVITDIANC